MALGKYILIECLADGKYLWKIIADHDYLKEIGADFLKLSEDKDRKLLLCQVIADSTKNQGRYNPSTWSWEG